MFTGFHTGFFLGEGKILHVKCANILDILKYTFLCSSFSDSLLKHLDFSTFFCNFNYNLLIKATCLLINFDDYSWGGEGDPRPPPHETLVYPMVSCSRLT